MCNFPPPPPFFPFFPNHLTNYSKTWAYDGKNVESVAYFLNNSQICKEQYSRTLGTTTTVTINNGTQVWRLIGEDEKGQPTNIGFGSLTQQLSFDLAGRVTGRKVRYGNEPYIQNAAYEYDVATGNMMMRTDSIYGHEEAFAYDYLNRLTDNGTGGYAYDTKGNVVRRDGVGGYGYSSASPYAVSEVPFNAMIPQRDQRIHYNALQLPDSICEGGTTAIFTYGGDLQRNSMRVTRGETSLSARYYDGTFNSFHRLRGENLDVKQILYLAGDAYTAPAAMVRDYGSGSWQLRHILRDNQGSIVAIADTAGNVIERNDYDPWGVHRQPQTQTPFSPGEAPELLLGRGYCGHEHLTEFGLINMNARLFDPALCRFLSPGPIVQAPDNSQNFNRYSYCLNNPMKYIDPSGLMVYYYDGRGNLLFTLPTEDGSMHGFLGEVVVTPNKWGVNKYTTQNSNVWFSQYNSPLLMDDNDNWNDYVEKIGAVSSKTSGGITGTKLLFEYKYNYTYIIRDSKGHFNPKIYTSGWKGNQYVKPIAMSTPLGKSAGVIGGVGLFVDCYNVCAEDDLVEKFKSGVDATIDAMGLCKHLVPQIISAVWSLGGRELFWLGIETSADNEVELFRMGISGHCTTMPFK